MPFDIDAEQFWTDYGPTVVQMGAKVVGVLVFLFVGWIVAGWCGRITKRSLGRAQVDETLTLFFGKLVRWAVLTFVLLGCLGAFGVPVTSFAAVLAAAGFAVGMALQGSLSNFAAGVMLLIFRPFKVGQVISAGGVTGKVVEIELFTTTIDTPDNRRLIVPNSEIFGSTIENVTYHDKRRVDVAVGVDYPADIDATRAVLLEAARSIDGVLADPEPKPVLVDLGDSAVNWTVRVWCATDDFWDVKESLTRAVKMHLDAADIGIPYPQMDVHLSNTDALAS